MQLDAMTWIERQLGPPTYRLTALGFGLGLVIGHDPGVIVPFLVGFCLTMWLATSLTTYERMKQ